MSLISECAFAQRIGLPIADQPREPVVPAQYRVAVDQGAAERDAQCVDAIGLRLRAVRDKHSHTRDFDSSPVPRGVW